MANCAFGMVEDIVYEPGLRPSGLPQVLMVDFDDHHGPFQTKIVPVTPISKS